MDPIAGGAPISLTCHPHTPPQAVPGIQVSVRGAPGDVLTLVFVLEGDLAGLRIPEPRLPGRANGLWRHTCFEVFMKAGQGPGYRELNFSPSGEWSVYGFRAYRQGGELEPEHAPEIAVRRTSNRLELDAQISREFLPQGRPLRLGLSAVLEDADGVLSYWALQHPPGRPDFHHHGAFAMQLALP